MVSDRIAKLIQQATSHTWEGADKIVVSEVDINKYTDLLITECKVQLVAVWLAEGRNPAELDRLFQSLNRRLGLIW